MINCANGEDLEFGDELTKQLDGDLDLLHEEKETG